MTTINGTNGIDTLLGSSGADIISALDGNDAVTGGLGADSIDGGAGTDVAIYSDSSQGVTVDLTTGAGFGGTAEGDTLLGVEDILGSSFADRLIGNGLDNIVEGGLGNDTAFLGAGNDTYFWRMGAGSDTIEGQEGSDRLFIVGADAADTLDLSANGRRMQMLGNPGAATLDVNGVERFQYLAFRGADHIHIGNMQGTGLLNARIDLGIPLSPTPGDQSIDEIAVDGSAETDIVTVKLTLGEIVVSGLSTRVGIAGAEATDLLTLEAGAGNDTLDASTLSASAAHLVLRGGLGDDLLKGGAGADIFEGGEGKDTIFGGAGDDFANTTTGGDDVFHGGAGNDFFFGFTGNETFFGDAGDDTLKGFTGDDLLEGGAGADRLEGGEGSDTVSYATATEGVNVLLAENLGFFGDAQNDRFDSIENVTGTAFEDDLFGNDAANILRGGAGADFLSGRAGADQIQGSGGNDTIDGGAAGDVIGGGAGSDTLSYAGSSSGVQVFLTEGFASGGDATLDTITGIEILVGSAFSDTLRGTVTTNLLDGSEGSDTLVGLGGNDTLRGGAGADVLDGGEGIDTADYSRSSQGVHVDLDGTLSNLGGEAAGDTIVSVENVIGSAFTDQLFGTFGANRLEGGQGADSLFGNNGKDVLIGGAGADSFEFFRTSHSGATSTTRDRITDFHVTESDKIDFDGIDANTGSAADDAFVFIGSGPFTAAGQVRAFLEGDHTVVELHTGGTLAADMQIELAGHVSLSSVDFLL